MLKSLDLLADKLTGSDKILQRGNTNASVAAVIGSAGVQGRLYQKKDLSSTILLNRLHPYTQMAAIQTTASVVGVPGKENITNVIIPNTIGIANTNNNSNNIPTAGIITTNTCTDLAIITAPSIDVTNSINNNNCNTVATMTAATILENNNNNNNYGSNDTSLTNETNNIKNQILSSNDNNNNNNNSSSNNNDGRSQIDYNIRDDEYSKEQPDPDTIKMFAGQIPKSMDEGQLKRLFEEYGRVHTINVLRDKITGVSRGCCFVTYYTRKAALRAQDALHNIKTLEGMHHPIQMKPADSENRNERKLFVGMLNKKYNEADVRQLFAGHGVIEECTVLRDQNGQSKGCAFVTFATKQAAAAAIKALDRSRTMEGCSAPLVVKFADTQKEKEQKKLQQIQANLWGIPTGTTNNLTPVTPTAPAVAPAPLTAAPTAAAAIAAATPQILATANPPQQATPYLATDAISPNSLQLFQQLQGVSLPPTFVQGLNTQPDHNAAMAAAGLLTTPMSMHNLMAIASVNHPTATHMMQAQQAAAHHQHHPHHPHHHHLHQSLQPSITAAHLTSATPTLWSSTEALSSAATYTPTAIPQLTNGAAFAAAAAAAAANAAVVNSPIAAAQAVQAQAQAHAAQQAVQVLNVNATYVAGKQVEGPEGSNLFIYHLPPEFTDTDLASTFLPFGKVISAKVFIDKNTQKTKGFGFVSYDNPSSAYIAIKAMNGFQIGIRKLKVQLKRSKDSAKPY